MPVILPKIVIGTMDKCASQWIKAAMKVACPEAEIQPHSPTLEAINLPNRLNVFFVRHPLAWYKSYWIFRQVNGYARKVIQCAALRHLDRYIAPRESFDDFIEKVLIGQKAEPYLTTQYRFMMSDRCDRVGTVENLVPDLIDFLDEAEQPYLPTVLLDYPKINVAARKVDWNTDLAFKICLQEHEVIDRWYT